MHIAFNFQIVVLFNSDTNFSFFVIKNVENNALAMQESKFGDKDFIKE